MYKIVAEKNYIKLRSEYNKTYYSGHLPIKTTIFYAFYFKKKNLYKKFPVQNTYGWPLHTGYTVLTKSYKCFI